MLPFSIFALLAIAGVGLSSFMPLSADASDEVEDDFVDEPDDGTDVPDDETPVYNNEPVILEISEDADVASLGDTLIGSEAADDISIRVNSLGALQTLDVGDGDDTVLLSGTESTSTSVSVYGGAGADDLSAGSSGGSDAATFRLFGGDGDDTIFAGQEAAGFGEAGNDQLTGSDGSTIYGGSGNDILDGETVENFRYNFGRAAYGGEGDDTLNIQRTAGAISTDYPDVGEWIGYIDRPYGGEGADTFDVKLKLEPTLDYFDEDRGDHHLLTLSDFTAGEDVLQVELSRPVIAVNIVNSESSTRVEFTFEVNIADEVATETVTSFITLADSNVTAEDIIVTVSSEV